MHLVPSGRDPNIVSAAKSVRKNGSVKKEYIYLGRLIDRDRSIFYNTDRGYYSFDLKTGEYSDPPDDFVYPDTMSEKITSRICLDFGDAYTVNSFIWKSGFMEVVDSIQYGNKETLHAMLLFYILSSLSNKDAYVWYDGSIVKLLYPRANMSSQRISDFLEAIGTEENRMRFQKSYISFIYSHYCKDKNILIDSTGLPNAIHMPMTNISIHNNKVSNEARLIFVVQKNTGLPVYYQAIPGNIVDVTTLENVLLHLDSLGIDIDEVLIDCGYNSADNLDLFYTSDHICKIDFIVRAASSDKRLKEMIQDNLATIERRENFVKYEDRYIFFVKKKIQVGSNQENPAWMYLGYDCSRASDEQRKLMKRAQKKGLSADEVYEAMQTEGLFGLISGKEYEIDEILPAYYQRQQAEQIFDIAKNYTKLLPLRSNREETFKGHLLLAFMACCVVKMMQIKFQTADLFIGSKLAALRNEKCIVYENRIVVDPPQAEARKSYQILGLQVPSQIPIVEHVLQYKHPEIEYEICEEPAADGSNEAVKRKAGRPKGSKNKKTLAKEAAQQTVQENTVSADEQNKHRGRGRPRGSKNKKTLEREAAIAKQSEMQNPVKRGRGRPKGSKNKKTLEREAALKDGNIKIGSEPE